MTEAQAALMEQLVQVLAADPRIRAAWLSGSLARGGGDAWSDVDLTVEVDEADRRACLSDYVSGRPGLPPLAQARGVPWPEAFDQATRRHLRQTLGLRI